MNKWKRYERHIKIPEIGHSGQKKLHDSNVIIIGCGGLGCVSASILARAGVGCITIVDDDCVATENLHRQILFDEKDAKLNRKKAVVIKEKLIAANSGITVIPRKELASPKNIISICDNGDVIVDGTDNMKSRFMINDASVKLGIPWIYGGVSKTEGMTMTIVPHTTPCFRCFITQNQENLLHSIENFGILSTIVLMIGSLQATQTIKILTGAPINKGVSHIDVWYNTWTTINVERKQNCPACGLKKFEFL